MANVEETLKEYDILHEPEEQKETIGKLESSDHGDTEKSIDTAKDATEKKTLSDTITDSSSFTLAVENLQHENVCPRVNCPEKILLCLDTSYELNETYFRSRVGEKLSAYKEIIRALRIFITNKTKINSQHEFGLVIFDDEAIWMKDFSKPKEVLRLLDDLINQPSMPAGSFDFTQLFHILKENLTLPEVYGDVRIVPPPYIIRVMFVYGRSLDLPLFSDQEVFHKMEASPYFFLDVLYVHEPLSGQNNCEAIFMGLCELEQKGLSYILEAASLTRLFDCMSMLLPHPLQRPLQPQALYHIAE